MLAAKTHAVIKCASYKAPVEQILLVKYSDYIVHLIIPTDQ